MDDPMPLFLIFPKPALAIALLLAGMILLGARCGK